MTEDVVVALICSVISLIIGGVVGYMKGKDDMEWQHELDSVAIEELKEELREVTE